MSVEDLFDPKGLIREAFAIDGIAAPECRSIFLDWALSVPAERDVQGEVSKLIAHYTAATDGAHPMLQVLQDALKTPQQPRRRGGRGGRGRGGLHGA